MKGYPQPLSEAFFYGSPETPAAGTFRWVRQPAVKAREAGKRHREVPHVGKRKH